MGLFKWAVLLIVVAIVAILILPAQILRTIGSGIGYFISSLVNALSSKLGAVASKNATSVSNVISTPPNTVSNVTINNRTTKQSNIILNVS
jgi:Sec-independent protein translocase protein TatA